MVLGDTKNVSTLWFGSGNTTYTATVSNIDNYKMLAFYYGIGPIVNCIPTELFKNMGAIRVSTYESGVGALIATFTYVSNTSITVQATQGSMVKIYGIN